MINKETFKKDYIRMMDSVRHDHQYLGDFSCRGVYCTDCPLKLVECEHSEGASDVVNIVEQWSIKHPFINNTINILDKIAKEVTDQSYLSYDSNPRHIIDEALVLDILHKYKEESEVKE